MATSDELRVRRWDEFITAFRDLVTRFNPAQDGGAEIESEYYLITADR